MLTLYIHPDLEKKLSAEQKSFDYFMQLQGECFRALEGRRTARLVLHGQPYFIKQHFGIGWTEIFKNLLQLKLPIISAKNEWQAIHRLQQLAVLTPTLMAYGEKGRHPAKQQSFILMKELTPTVSLEDFCRDWQQQPPSFSLKRALIAQVAAIARTLHRHGIYHRDFYLCHFLLSLPVDSQHPQLYLIDLHRAGFQRKLRRRWIIKDLAGLYFSSKRLGLTRQDYWYFIKNYHQQDIAPLLKSKDDLWQKVITRGEKLYCVTK